MTRKKLSQEYNRRLEGYLKPLAKELEIHLESLYADSLRIDRIRARAKDVDRFLSKAAKKVNGKLKYLDPLNQIHDQIGVRIITFYLDDVDRVSKIIEDYFAPIEAKRIIPDSESEFGYEGKHYILFLPEDILDDKVTTEDIPKFFELQIKTLYQHAWSEANHDLGYKSEIELEPEEKRRIAFTAAQSWGADQIYNELFLSRTS